MSSNLENKLAKIKINKIKKIIEQEKYLKFINEMMIINDEIVPNMKRQQIDISQLVPSYVQKLKDLPYGFFAKFFQNLEAIWPEINISNYGFLLELVDSILYNVDIITQNLVKRTDIVMFDRFFYLLLTKKYFENVRKLLIKIYSFKGKLSTDQLQLFETMTRNKPYYSMIPYFNFFNLEDFELRRIDEITYKKYFGNHNNFEEFKTKEESDVDKFEYVISGDQKKLHIGFGILGTIIVGLGVLVIKLSKN